MAKGSNGFGTLLADIARACGTPSASPLYSIILKQQIEHNMDRAPTDEAARNKWCTIHRDLESRIYSTILRYSYCYPIFHEYAVRTGFVAARGKRITEEDDSIAYDSAGEAMPLTPNDIAWILDIDEDNCRSVMRRMERKGLIRFNTARRCFLSVEPTVPDGKRPVRSQRSKRRQPGLPSSVASRLERASAHLPEEVRTNLQQRAVQNRTNFLEGLRRLRYEEKKGYDDLCTEAHDYLSLQNQT